MNTLSPVEELARPSLLDQAIARLCDEDATISDVRALLQLLADGDVDPVRTQGLLVLANNALARFSADVMCAPPAALNDTVKVFATSDCKAAHIGCDVEVTEWTADNGYCSRSCLVAGMRANGEPWRD